MPTTHLPTDAQIAALRDASAFLCACPLPVPAGPNGDCAACHMLIRPHPRALVSLPRAICPQCHTPTTTTRWAQLPLLRHAGYGAAQTTTIRHCPNCTWHLTTEISEVRP